MSDIKINIIYVTNTNNDGEGSFRNAILEANQSILTITKIIFNVKGIIILEDSLPNINSEVLIDAVTDLDYTNYPLIEINCNNNNGLVFDKLSSNSSILGLSIYNSANNGVTIYSNNITINNNYIFLNKADGIYIGPNSNNNIIGLNPTLSSIYTANLISSNGGNGIQLNNSSYNTIIKNYIGTDINGLKPLPNEKNGILITNNSSYNTIGGTAFINSEGIKNNPTGSEGKTTPVYIIPPEGNLISGNLNNGVLIENNSSYNTLNGNFIGTSFDGNNSLENNLNGVFINHSDNNALIGCQFENNPFVYYNVISGNGSTGLQIKNSNDTIVQANFFGISANNSIVIPNASDGILVNGNSDTTTIGGPIPLGNVSSGNLGNGIRIGDTAKSVTSYNTFAGGFAFGGAAPNANNGILVISNGGNQLIRTCVCSGNKENGIALLKDAFDVTIDPIIAGLTTNGQALLSNGKNGLLIGDNANNNIIGGTLQSIIPRNIFSGNEEYGICIQDNAYSNSILVGFIGLSLDNSNTTLGNKLGGIILKDTCNLNVIGSDIFTDENANYIGYNEGPGITLETNTYGNKIINNFIGYDTNHTPAPNMGLPIADNSINQNYFYGNTTLI
jgi:hypothetical protein